MNSQKQLKNSLMSARDCASNFYAENGKIKDIFKSIMVVNNIFQAFQNSVDIDNFPELVSGSYYLLSILFKNLGVVTRQA